MIFLVLNFQNFISSFDSVVHLPLHQHGSEVHPSLHCDIELECILHLEGNVPIKIGLETKWTKKTKADKTCLPMLIGEDTFVITLVLCPCFL